MKRTKLSIAVDIVRKNKDLDKATSVAEIMQALTVTKANAGVYYFKAMKLLGGAVEPRMVIKPAPASDAFVCSDGGRRDAGFDESNDCAVRAYAHFAGVPYAKAHAMFKEVGRRDRRGTYIFQIAKVLGGNGTFGDGMTLKRLRELHPGKTIYCVIRRHAFALVNGVLYDDAKVGNGSRIKRYWLA